MRNKILEQYSIEQFFSETYKEICNSDRCFLEKSIYCFKTMSTKIALIKMCLKLYSNRLQEAHIDLSEIDKTAIFLFRIRDYLFYSNSNSLPLISYNCLNYYGDKLTIRNLDMKVNSANIYLDDTIKRLILKT